jgi:hypothetical protein
MKTYPSLGYWNNAPFGESCIGFKKLDGSNMRFEWSKKRGWYKVGSRTELISERHPVLGASIPIFYEKYADKLDQIFMKNRKVTQGANKVIVFCEFFGPNSFAGWHDPNDEKDLVLFDVHVFKRGFVKPREFIKYFSEVGIPEVKYDGIYTPELVKDVRAGKYGEFEEGLVVKGTTKKDNTWMVKLKTDWWLSEIKNRGDEEKISYSSL